MILKTTLFILFFLAQLSLISQSIINQSTVWPIGQEGDFYETNTSQLVTSTRGANQVWDFSYIDTVATDKFDFEVVDPATTPNVSEFPESNIAVKYSSLSTASTYEHFKNTPNGLITNLRINEIPFPFNYTDSVIYTSHTPWYDTTRNDTLKSTFHGTLYIVYDGHGTLISPHLDTVKKVSRIHRHMNGSIEKYKKVGGVWQPYIFYRYFSDDFSFIDQNNFLLLKHKKYSGNQACKWYITHNNTSSYNNLQKEDFFGLYPNPAQETLFITADSEFNNKKNLQYTIINPSGQKVGEGDLNKSISIKNLNKGYYFIKIIGNDFYAVKRFIKN